MNFELLGMLLKEARVSRGYTQADIANMLEITSQNVSSWERGKSKIDIDTLVSLCDIYGIDFVNLIDRVKNEKTSEPVIDSEEDVKHRVELLTDFFVKAGYMELGGDISNDTLRFFTALVDFLDSYFSKK